MSEIELRDGSTLWVEQTGSGPPALLLHGFTGSSGAWGEALLEELGQDLRVLAVDLLGHGRSSKPRSPERYAIEEQVEDLREVLRALEVEQAIWVGYSMGGRLALAAGLLRPSSVRAVVLEGASPGLEDPTARAERRQTDEHLAASLERDGLEPFVESWMSLPLFASQQALPAAVLEAHRKRRLENDPRALAASLRGCGSGTQPSFWASLGALSQPALLIAGELDSKFRGLRDAMALRMPQATRAEIPGAGHTTHLEQPQTYSKQVRAFARSLQGAECR